MDRKNIIRFIEDWNISYNQTRPGKYNGSARTAGAPDKRWKQRLIRQLKELPLSLETLVTREGNLLIKAKELAVSDKPENLEKIHHLMKKAENLTSYSNMA
ncbi:MAG: hypothetical protein ACLFP1_08470 [Candidatus Goldiibacteriota bacterium]